MPTVVYVDLRGKPPYYRVLSREPDRTVYVTHGRDRRDRGGAVTATEAPPDSEFKTLSTLRDEILDATSTKDVLESMAAMSADIQAAVRGDNVGPVLIPRVAKRDDKKWKDAYDAAHRETDPERRRQLFILSDLERAYADAVAAAEQIVHDAIAAGADWLIGDAAYATAIGRRNDAVDRARREFNLGLPPGMQGHRKSYGGFV